MRPAVLAVLLAAPPAAAHTLHLDVAARPDPRRLELRAAYDGDDPADGATAVVQDSLGAEVGRTTLDADGRGTLPWPAGGWAVTVDDGAGHRAVARSDGPASGERPGRWLALAAGLLLISGWWGVRRMRSGG